MLTNGPPFVVSRFLHFGASNRIIIKVGEPTIDPVSGGSICPSRILFAIHFQHLVMWIEGFWWPFGLSCRAAAKSLQFRTKGKIHSSATSAALNGIIAYERSQMCNWWPVEMHKKQSTNPHPFCSSLVLRKVTVRIPKKRQEIWCPLFPFPSDHHPHSKHFGSKCFQRI